MQKPQALLAYEMNGQTLPINHGAPLRLRAETKLGFKMVKYLRSIEFVEDLASVGKGSGGYKEDYEFYDKEAVI
jgi:DMSO/TMAO reductase YedYZ molybdopterin-dependent catalytic subunit